MEFDKPDGVVFLSLRDSLTVLLTAAGCEPPRHHRCFVPVAVPVPNVRVNEHDEGALAGEWFVLGDDHLARVAAAGDRIGDVASGASRTAAVEAFRLIQTLWSNHYEDLRPYYDPARGHPLRWKRAAALHAEVRAHERVDVFTPTLWAELGPRALWDALDADVVQSGSWDVELFFPRANVERFAQSLCGDRAAPNDNAPEKWVADLEGIVLGAGGMKITPAMRALIDSSPAYAGDPTGDLVLVDPSGRRQTVPRGTVANKLAVIRKKLPPSSR